MTGRLWRLIVALMGLWAIWLVALPWMAQRPQVSERLDWLDDKGIDPSAMYYTELEMMKPIFHRMALNKRNMQVQDPTPAGSISSTTREPS